MWPLLLVAFFVALACSAPSLIVLGPVVAGVGYLIVVGAGRLLGIIPSAPSGGQVNARVQEPEKRQVLRDHCDD